MCRDPSQCCPLQSLAVQSIMNIEGVCGYRYRLWLVPVLSHNFYYRLQLCPVYRLSQVRGKGEVKLPSLGWLKAAVPTNSSHCGHHRAISINNDKTLSSPCDPAMLTHVYNPFLGYVCVPFLPVRAQRV